MFTLPAVFFVALATGVITNQVTKHGWGVFIDHDEVKPKPKYEPKYSKPVYDWKKDKGFKNPNERKSA